MDVRRIICSAAKETNDDIESTLKGFRIFAVPRSTSIVHLEYIFFFIHSLVFLTDEHDLLSAICNP